MSALQLFCYLPQRRAIEGILHPLLDAARCRLRPVEHHFQLQGVRCGTFAYLPNMHSAVVPEQVLFAARAQGFVIWTIDDSEARARWGGIV